MSLMIISIIIISIIGTFLHFLYDITKHNKVVGIFAAVNESTWEHIKIALTPTLIWGLIDGAIYGMEPNYFLAKFISLTTIIILMPVLFYGYKFFLKKHNLIIDVIIFYIVIICSQYLFFYFIRSSSINFFGQYLSCVAIFIIIICYSTLTLMPVKNFLFKDPISNKYGYKGHIETHNHSHKH